MNKMNKKTIWLCADLAIAAFLILLDQWTKQLAIGKLKGQEAFVILRGIFELEYLENRGSAFGMFQGKKVFLLIVGVLFMAVMLYLLIKTPAEKRFLPIHIVASGIIAGGIGNMIDRFFLGYVVDFFSFVLIHFPVFNVADSYIVIATIAMAILLIFVYQEEELQFLWKSKKIEGEPHGKDGSDDTAGV